MRSAASIVLGYYVRGIFRRNGFEILEYVEEDGVCDFYVKKDGMVYGVRISVPGTDVVNDIRAVLAASTSSRQYIVAYFGDRKVVLDAKLRKELERKGVMLFRVDRNVVNIPPSALRKLRNRRRRGEVHEAAVTAVEATLERLGFFVRRDYWALLRVPIKSVLRSGGFINAMFRGMGSRIALIDILAVKGDVILAVNVGVGRSLAQAVKELEEVVTDAKMVVTDKVYSVEKSDDIYIVPFDEESVIRVVQSLTH